MSKPDIKILGFFYQGQGHFQFAAEVNGKLYEGCRSHGSRRTEWTKPNEKYAGIPPRGLALPIARAADAAVTAAWTSKS